MSSEGWITCRWGQDGYGLLIRNYPVTLSLWHCLVKIIPHIHLLKAFSLRYRHFWGGGKILIAWLWADLKNHVAAVQHRTETVVQSTSASGDQHARCCEDLLFYDWNVLLFLITRSLFPLSFCTSYYCQLTTANHTSYDAFSSAPFGYLK